MLNLWYRLRNAANMKTIGETKETLVTIRHNKKEGKKMKKIKLSPLQGLQRNNGVHKVQSSNHKINNDYGVPKMRPCGFPSNPNPFEKRGKRLGNIHKMYTFKSMTGSK